EDDIFGPRYAEINVKGVQVAIPEEDQLPQESHIEIERMERQIKPDKNLMIACITIILILVVMLGTCAVLFCYLRRFNYKDVAIGMHSDPGRVFKAEFLAIAGACGLLQMSLLVDNFDTAALESSKELSFCNE
ncbi:hypothetical protein lerEdw1_020911, partial [Lerista edwardsae]